MTAPRSGRGAAPAIAEALIDQPPAGRFRRLLEWRGDDQTQELIAEDLRFGVRDFALRLPAADAAPSIEDIAAPFDGITDVAIHIEGIGLAAAAMTLALWRRLGAPPHACLGIDPLAARPRPERPPKRCRLSPRCLRPNRCAGSRRICRGADSCHRRHPVARSRLASGTRARLDARLCGRLPARLRSPGPQCGRCGPTIRTASRRRSRSLSVTRQDPRPAPAVGSSSRGLWCARRQAAGADRRPLFERHVNPARALEQRAALLGRRPRRRCRRLRSSGGDRRRRNQPQGGGGDRWGCVRRGLCSCC